MRPLSLDRASQNDAQFQTAFADAQIARDDRVQARSSLLPALSATTQYLGNSPNGVNPNGRFVSLDGVKMYRAWGVVHEDLTANVITGATLHRAPEDQFYGDRDAFIVDPFGHGWTVASHVEDVSPDELTRRMAALFAPTTAEE